MIEQNPNIAHVSMDEQLASACSTVGVSSVGSSCDSVPSPGLHGYPELA